MQPLWATLKTWIPTVAALACVVAASVYAFSRKAQVSEGIRDMRHIAATLTNTADTAEHGVLSPREIEALQQKRSDFEQRMADSFKPGRVVSQLSESARKSGLVLLEIQPVRNRPRGATGEGRRLYPMYRVSVRGSYERIAEYMEGCAQQRLPARVIGFRLGRPDGQSDGPRGLKAEITVEAFQAVRDVGKSG